MSKVASAAAAMGVGEDQLAAQLSTIISVTRQAPETVGTALRTVYARITDIQAGIDEDGVTLGKYSGDMAKIGISVLDLNGNLRNMGEVMEEIGNKWSTMTQEQKIYLAQTMAGQRQYSNLMALFDNFDKYESALNTAQNAGGKLQEQQDVYMDRLSTHVQQLTTATEHMWMGLFDTDGFKDVIDGLTTIVEKVDKLFQSIGGGKNLLQSLVPIVMSLTSKTVASGINTMIMNSQLEKRQLRDQRSSQALAQKEMKDLQREGQQGSQRYQIFKQKSEFLQAAPGTFSAQQMDEINQRWSGSLEAAAEADKRKTELNQYSDITRSITTTLGNNVVDLKETLSIEDLENAIIDVGGQYDELSIRIKQYAQDQDEINKQQEAAQQKLIEAYSQTATKIVSEKNESQFKQFNLKNLRKYESTQAQIISHEQQKLDALSKSHNDKKQVINDSALTGMFNIKRNRKKGDKVNDDQISEIEKVKGFEEVQDIKGKEEKIKKIKEIFENSIYKEIYEQMHPKSAADFKKAVRNRYTEIEKAIQQASNKQKAASQELLRRQQTTNTYQQNFQALKGNLQIQNVDKFQNNLQFLSQDFSSMAIPPELKTQVISIKKEYQKLSQEIIKYNEKIQSSSKLSQEQIDALKKEKKALEEKQQALLDTTQGTVDSINANVQNKGQQAIDELKYSRTIGNNNRGAIGDIQDDADRQKAIQSAIQLVSALGQVQMGFENFLNVFQIMNDDTLSFGEKFSQTLRNLTMSIPMVVSGIISMNTALKTLTKTETLQAAIKSIATKQLWANTAGLIANTKALFTNIAVLGKKILVSAASILGPWGVAAAVIAAVIGSLKIASDLQKKQVQGQIKANEKIIDQEKQKQEEIKHNQDIISEVQALNKSYEDGIITRQELKEKTQELQQKYQDESAEIRNLISDYNNLGEAAKKAKEKQLEEMYKSKGKEAQKLSQNIDFKLTSQMKNQDDFFGGFFTTGLGAWGAQAQGNAVIKAGGIGGNAGLSKELGDMLKAQNLGDFKGDYVELWNAKNGEEARKQVEILQQVVENATEEEKQSNDYRNMVELLEEMSPMLEEWKSANLQSLNLIAQQQANRQASNFNNINNFEEYEAAYQKTSKAIYEQMQANGQLEGKTLEEINDIVARKTEAIIPKDLKTQYGDKVDAINKINHYNGAGYFGLNETDDEIIDLINGLNEEQLSKFLSLDIEDMQTLDDVKRVLKTISEYDFKNLDFNIADAKKAAQTYNNMANALQKVQNSKAISAKDFEEGLGLTDEIKSYFRLGNNGYVLKDESQRKIVEQLIKQQQRSGWDDKYRIQKNIQENEQSWLDSKANNYNPQMWSQLPPQEDRISQEDKKILQELKEGSYTGKASLKEKYIKAGIISEEEWDNKIQQIMQQTYGRNFFVKGEDKTQFYKKVGEWLSEEISTYNIDQQQSNINDINVANAQKMIEKLESVNDEEINVQLSKFKGYIKDGKISKQDYEKIYNYFNDISKSHKGAAEKIEEASSQQQEALLQIHESIFPTDDDVDETIVAKLGEQFQLTAKKSKLLDDALESNAKKAKNLAEEYQRYNSALSRVIKNYATWQNKLSGSTADKLSVAPQIKDAMADTLGISENTLSDTFVTTTQNLEDMRLALEGDEKAYKRLQQAAYEDILIHIGLDDANLNEVQILLDEYFKNLDLDVAVGAELDQTALEKVLATLIKKGIDTEQQLEAIFASKGIDLDVVIEDGKAEILSYTKAATYELKEQEKSQEELKNLERERIKNQKELTKYLRDDRDLYHEINILLKDQEKIINRITKNQDSMYGAELLQNLSAQTNELRKQQALLKSKQQMQLQDMANRKSALASQGAAFDSNGNIINYNNLIGSAMNKVNEIISRQNGIISAKNNIISSGGSTNDEAYKNLELQEFLINREKSNAQEYLSNLKSDLSAYESVKSDFEDVIDQLSNLVYQKIELRLKEFKVKVDVKYDLIQLQKDYDDFRRNIVEHDDILNPNKIKTILKDSAQYFSDALSSLNYLPSLADDLQKAINEANKFNDINYDPAQDPNAMFKTQGQAKTYLQQALEKVNSQSKDVLSNIDEIKNKILELANELKDVYTKQEQHLSFIREQINHNISLSKLLYGEESYKNLNKYYDQLKTYNLKSVEDAKSQQQMFLELYQRETDKALKDIYLQNYKQATKTLNSILESSLQDLKTRYENAINEVLKNTKEKLGFTYNTGLEWDLMKKQNDTFLDKVNSTFAIKNTEFLYNQAINDIDSISAQVKLKNVMNQQLEILKEKQQLTQYDVDRAQKVLDIQKARIALEQAQNNKTNMRLKRDSQGNYSYQFVADEDEIAKAQNNLDKTKNDLYNFDKEHYIENLNQAQELYEEYANKIREIKLNDNLNQIEKTKALGLLREDFEKRILKIWKQNEFIKRNLIDSTANSLKMNLQNMSAAEQNYFMGQSIPMWNSSAQQILNKFIDDPNSVYNEIENMYSSLTQAQNDYQSSIDQSLEKAGTSYEQFKKTGIDPVVDSMKELIKNNNELAKEANTIVEEMQPLKTTLGSLTDKWEEMRKKIEEVNGQIQNYLINMGKAALAAQNNGNNGSGIPSSGLPTQLTNYSASGGGATKPIKSNESVKNGQSSTKQPTFMDLKSALKLSGVPSFWDKMGGSGLPDKYVAQIKNEFANIKNNNNNQIGWAMKKALDKAREISPDGATVYGFSKDYVYTQTQKVIKSIVLDAMDKAAKSYGWGGTRSNIYGLTSNSGEQKLEYIAQPFSNKNDLLSSKGLLRQYWKAFDTGGYTGSWNSSDGKLAMLHQKELVLNKQDTKNILNAVSLVRTITNNLASNLMSQINSIGKFENMTKTFMNDKFNQIEQNVKIQANFPNVNSKQEIEDAFAELVNMAAQRALRKNN